MDDPRTVCLVTAHLGFPGFDCECEHRLAPQATPRSISSLDFGHVHALEGNDMHSTTQSRPDLAHTNHQPPSTCTSRSIQANSQYADLFPGPTQLPVLAKRIQRAAKLSARVEVEGVPQGRHQGWLVSFLSSHGVNMF